MKNADLNERLYEAVGRVMYKAQEVDKEMSNYKFVEKGTAIKSVISALEGIEKELDKVLDEAEELKSASSNIWNYMLNQLFEVDEEAVEKIKKQFNIGELK